MSNQNEKESMDIDNNQNPEANNNDTDTQEKGSVKSVSSPSESESNHKKDTTNKKQENHHTNASIKDKKKAALQEKLRRMVTQNREIVTTGCGEWRCTNPFCKSNVENYSKQYSESEASKMALQMIKSKAKACSSYALLNAPPLTQELIEKIAIDEDEETKTDEEARDWILFAFKHWQCVLSSSFMESGVALTDKQISIDFDALGATFSAILERESLCKDIRCVLEERLSAWKYNKECMSFGSLRAVVVLLLNPLVLSEDIGCHSLLILIVRIVSEISSCDFSLIVVLRAWFEQFALDALQTMLSSLQQFMTLRISCCEDEIEDLTDEWRCAADESSTAEELEEFEEEIARKQWVQREKYILSDIAGVCCVIDVIWSSKRVSAHLFCNDGLNCTICSQSATRGSMHRRDFIHYRERDFFTFLSYPYLLSAASKSKYLEFENLLSQHRARRRRMFGIMLGMGGAMSRSRIIEELDLVLRIRRTHLIEDTLGILSVHAVNNNDLRKRLRIIFDGEEGIDQGGLTKEYFQLIMAELFDPKYGMFIQRNENYWFAVDAFDHDLSNYELVGKLIGIAIYNNTILDFRFPRVLFKKMLSTSYVPTLDDLASYDPQMSNALVKMRTMENIEEVYCRNFIVEYHNMFGELASYDLTKCGAGHSKMLSNENCEEYIVCYLQYILSDSIAAQFGAFYKGWRSVCDSELFDKLLFDAKELELLICGSDKFDFDALEETTKYQDGLHKNSRLVRDFWNIAHQLSQEDKRKLLTFCTGSDRVPINGLGELTLTISKNGNDNKRLPTSHTCFNHLLLPEYDTKQILKLRLLTAIQNSQGFGLL